MLRPLIFFVSLAGCSVGSLDLDGKDPDDDDRYWGTGESTPDSVEMLEMTNYAEQGYSLYVNTLSLWGDNVRVSGDRGDQVILPLDFGKEVIRESWRQVETNQLGADRRAWQPYYCKAATKGPLLPFGSCEVGQICGNVDAQVLSRDGPTPCPEADGAYTLKFEPKSQGLTLSFADPAVETKLARVTTAFDGPWKATSLAGAPAPLVDPVAEVFGKRVLVFGRAVSGAFDGGLYDPGLDKWTPLAQSDMPSGTGAFRPIWTGSLLLVFLPSGGAVFDPAANAWRKMGTEGAPALDGQNFAAAYDLAGNRAFVYGNGQGGAGTKFSVGAIYDVEANSWSSFPVAQGPVADEFSGGAWTGTELLIWSEDKAGRALYYPQTQEWVSFSSIDDIDLPENKDGKPSRVLNSNGHVLILPAGVAYSPSEGKWNDRQDSLLSSWVDRSAAVQFDKGNVLAFAGQEIPGMGHPLGAEFHSIRPILFPKTPSSPELRSGAAVAKTGEYLFYYGGCLRFANERCQVFSREGAAIRLAEAGKR